MTASPSTRPRPSLVVTEVKHEGHFEESKHPRDKHGRFMHVGDHVDLGGGSHGEVVGTASDGKITVRKTTGGTVNVDPGKVTRTAGGDGAAPRPYAGRTPRVGDVVVLDDGREGEVRRVYADGRSIKFSFVERDGSITREKVDKGSVAKITSAAPESVAPGERRAPNLSGIQHLPEDVRQELTDAVQEMTSLYDVPFAGVTAREEDWHGGNSFAIGGTTIMFNPKVADPEYRQRMLIGQGYTLGRTMREAFIHEFGHTIDRQHIADQGKQKRKGAAPLHQMFVDVEKSGDRVAQGEMNPDFNPSDPDSTLWLYPDGTHADLSERVSGYAASGDAGEAVAESFLAGHLGRTNRYTLAVRAAFAPYVRQDQGSAVDPTDDGHRIIEPIGPKPVPGPDPSAMTPTAITTELRALGESLNGMDPSGRAWGPITARRDLLASELLNRAGYGSLATGGRKVTPVGTLRTMGTTGRARPYLVIKERPPVQMTAQETLQALIEGKRDGRFDPAKHPRDKHGRFAHIGDLVKLADGKHGRITAVGADGKLTVRKESGGTVNVAPGKVTKVTGEATGATDSAVGVARGMRRLPKQGSKEGTGTIDDPIAVGGDIERAAKLISEGKHVRLDQPDQVVTLVDKLRQMVADAKARGEKAPTYDLGKVTVPGTNLFTQESKGVPRINMPQFRGKPAPGSPAEAFRGAGGDRANIEQPFRDALAAMGIPTRHGTVPASHLRASQRELDGGKIAGIAAAMKAGKMPDVPIFVTRDNYVIDGHHRWAGKIVTGLGGGNADMPVEIVDLDIGAALDYANAFAKVMGISSQSIDDPGSGKPPVAAATKVIYVDTAFPADFRERMTKALAEIADPAAPAEPVDAAPAVVGPASSRIGSHIDTVYGMTPVHHIRRGIEAAYTRHSGGRKHPAAANLRP